MRTLSLLLLSPLITLAQLPPPVVTGVLLERDAPGAAGQFSVRAADYQVYRFQFDGKTHVERDGRTADVGTIEPGDKVEVECDSVPGSLLRYARTIHATAPVAPPRPLSEGRFRAVRPALTGSVRTGNLTFSGVVAKFNDQRLVLHTRGGDQTLLIRRDTRYVENGDTVEAAELKPNMRVFVRAGKDLYEQVEAYQVIWGAILEPKH